MSSEMRSSLREMRKILSVENAAVYCALFEIVVRGGKSVADVKRELKRTDQSGIMKIIDALNQKISDIHDTPLVWRSPDKRWIATALGEAFYEIAKKIEASGEDIEKAISRLTEEPVIRIGVNSFSYEALLSIEDGVRELFGEVRYKKIIHGHRSSELLHRVSRDELLDITISEYTNELVGETKREYLKISEDDIYFLSNHMIEGEAAYNGTGESTVQLSFRDIEKYPLMLGDTKSFVDLLLLHSSYGASLNGDKRQKLKHIWNMDLADKKEIVRREFNVRHESTSVHLMMDMFLFDPMHLCMLASKEVTWQLRARLKAAKAQNQGRRVNKVYLHPLKDKGVRLYKYALRHIQPQVKRPETVADMFWEACGDVEKKLREKSREY